MDCIHCKKELSFVFADLGIMPAANAYESSAEKAKLSPSRPLRALVCDNCFLVQCEQFHQSSELFSNDYAYFASISKSWLEHAKNFCSQITKELSLSCDSSVCEIAANDGYLLKNFLNTEIAAFGIEPTASTAEFARNIGIDIVQDFFSSSLAIDLVKKRGRCDLIIANNVFAHVPNINDFSLGLKMLLNVNGTVTIEFQHVLSILKGLQFDTIYHEHFSYLSLLSTTKILKSVGLRPFKVIELSTHGGSLRLYACHDDDPRKTHKSIDLIREKERLFGLDQVHTYTGFQKKVESLRSDFLEFLKTVKQENKKVIAYGAAAKGNTLLNFSGVTTDDISVVYDAAPSKQNMFLPGSGIPIKPPSELKENDGDFMLILPWNLASEIITELKCNVPEFVKCFTAVPRIKFYE